MIFLIWFLILLIIFPISLNFYGYLSLEDKKFYFGIYLYNFTKIFGGYARIEKDCVSIHYSNKKALLIFYNKVFKMRNKIKIIRDYHIIKLNSLVEIGTKNNIILPSALASIYVWHNHLLCDILHKFKPYIKIKNNVDVYEDDNFFKIYLRFNLLLNILMILLSIIKIMTGRLLNAIKRHKNFKLNKKCN